MQAVRKECVKQKRKESRFVRTARDSLRRRQHVEQHHLVALAAAGVGDVDVDGGDGAFRLGAVLAEHQRQRLRLRLLLRLVVILVDLVVVDLLRRRWAAPGGRGAEGGEAEARRQT